MQLVVKGLGGNQQYPQLPFPPPPPASTLPRRLGVLWGGQVAAKGLGVLRGQGVGAEGPGGAERAGGGC